MLILSLDTASPKLSVAILEDATPLFSFEEVMPRGQGEALLPIIQEGFKKINREMKELQLITTGVGPGSFTGVRVGLACARGFGLALNIPVHGVTSFEAAAFNQHQKCMAVIDSKRGDFFVQEFSEKGEPVSSAKIANIEDLKTKMPFAVVGDAAQTIHEVLGAKILKEECLAVQIAKKALSRTSNPLPAEPFYMREADVTCKS